MPQQNVYVVDTARSLGELERRLNALAAQGFKPCMIAAIPGEGIPHNGGTRNEAVGFVIVACRPANSEAKGGE